MIPRLSSSVEFDMAFDSHSAANGSIGQVAIASMRMEETMNVATRLAILRTELANERTFLSWVRSAGSLVTLGVGIGEVVSGCLCWIMTVVGVC